MRQVEPYVGLTVVDSGGLRFGVLASLVNISQPNV